MKLRSILTTLVLLACLGLMAGQLRGLLADPTIMPPDDFVEYWAAGRLNLNGQNPYSYELLLPLEQIAGRDTDEAIMMWNPPWTLPLVMPFGAMPARVAQLAWLLFHFALTLLGTDLLWRRLGGAKDKRYIAWALSLTFLPVFFALRAGQITPVVFFGVVIFLELQARNKPGWAGAAAVLMAIKPHLLLFIWIAIVVQAIATRKWTTVVGGILAGIFASAIALAFNPDVFSHYFNAYRTNPPVHWMSLTLGTMLRLAFGQEHFWFNAIPAALGLLWFMAKYVPQVRRFNLVEELPLLVLVSFLLAPYGAWHFDLVLLLVPMIHRAVTLSQTGSANQIRIAMYSYVFALIGMIAVNLAGITSIWFAWVAPFTFAVYLLTGKTANATNTPSRTLKVPLGVSV